MSQSVWKEFLTKINQFEFGNDFLFNALQRTKLIELTDTRVIVECEDAGIGILLNKKKPKLEDDFGEFMGKRFSIQFSTKEKKQKKEKELPLLDFEPSTEDIVVKSGLRIKYQFDNYAVSSSNQVAFAAAQAVAKAPGHSYNPLFLYGGVGVGKTHLAQAIGVTILKENMNKRVYFCPGDQFTNELIEAIREKNTQRFRRKYRHLDLIIIDDIQFIAGKQTVQEEFFHTFNTIVSAGGQVILTSDRPPHEIKNLEDRLRSRFSGGLIADVQEPDFELRTAIILIKASEKNIAIDMDAAKRICEIVTDTRALEGTLLSIYAQTLGKQETIDITIVDSFFDNKVARAAKKVSPHDVIKTVCSFFNVKQSHIKGPGRSNHLALARQVIMYILRTQFGMNLTEIAATLKRKDHTTVMHGSDKVARLMMRDQQFKAEVDTIISSIHSST